MELSDRVRRLAPSFALAIHYRYKEMLRQGKDVVSFAVGEPDFDTPAHIKKAGIEATEQGWTKYSVTPRASGTPGGRLPSAQEEVRPGIRAFRGDHLRGGETRHGERDDFPPEPR